MRNLLWSPVLAWPLITLLALLIASAIGWSLWHGLHSRRQAATSGGLRFGALAVLALILLQPQYRYDEVTVLKPQLAVLVDTSESMIDRVDDAQPSRADRAKEWLASATLTKARKDFDLRIFHFDTKLSELTDEVKELPFRGSSSHVVLAVNQAQERFRGQPLAGVLLLSDGIDTGGAARAAAMTAGVAVHTFELESEFQPKQKGRRISLRNVDFPARVVVGWEQEIKAEIVGSGVAGATVGVELWRNGKKEQNATLAFNEGEQARPVVFAVAPDKPGMMQYELRVTDDAADDDAKNYAFVIEALMPGKRILYLQNSLGFDFKFLRKALVSDRNLQLSAFVRWGDGRIVSMGERGQPSDATLDFSAAGLSQFSVVMLGDLSPDALTPENLQTLKEFVSRGGGLILLGGANALPSIQLAQTPLADVSPVKLPAEYREGNVTVSITDAGLRHPVFGPLFAAIKEFPPLLTVNLAGGTSATAEVLMEGDISGAKVPLIASSRFGQGRVVAVMTDTIWRWRLAAETWTADRSPYDTFWTQLMDWLIPKEQDIQGGNRLELFTERGNYLLGERPEVRAILSLAEIDAVAAGRTTETARPPPASLPRTLPLTVKTPDGKTFEYTMKAASLPGPGGQQVPGYRAEVEPNVSGVFSASSRHSINSQKLEGETRFAVTKPATELTGKPIDRALLQQIAEQTGGKFYTLHEGDQWPADIHYQQQQFARVQVSDLWNHPLLLMLFFGLLGGDWICRKFWNLP